MCQGAVCKHCAQFVDEESFAYSPASDVKFAHGAYCCHCFDNHIAEHLDTYNRNLEAARNVIVFTRAQGKESRRYARNAPAVSVEDCADSGEALMKLAYLAVKAGYNGLVNVDIRSKKLKINFYQTTKWSGSGIPTHIDEEHLARVERISTWVNQT